jgi:hypothetical protein
LFHQRAIKPPVFSVITIMQAIEAYGGEVRSRWLIEMARFLD